MELIQSVFWVDGPVTAIMVANWCQGYLIITGLGVIARWIRNKTNEQYQALSRVR